MKNKELLHQIKIVLAFGAIYLIWGSSFYANLLALRSFPPFLLSTLRFLIGGVAVLGVCAMRKEPLPTWYELKRNMLYGIVIFMGAVVTVAWAQQFVSSSLASIIITTPFWFVVLDRREWGFYFSNKWIITGLITGLIGVILLLGNRQGRVVTGDETMQLIGILTIIFGSFCWVSASLHIKYNPLRSSSYVNTCIQLLTAGIICITISLIRHEPQSLVLNDLKPESVAAILYLAIISSLITFMAFMWLIKIKPAAIVSTYSYVNPVVAVLLGWGFAGEHISGLQIFALFVILSGVLFVNMPKYKTVQTMPPSTP
jgi:drug/metabolite transporter (DMT)-like permease